MISSSHAQTGGDNTYEFLNLTPSARIAALGGNFLAVKDNDISLSLANPSLITPGMHNQLALSFQDQYADISQGFVMYGRSFGNVGNFVASLQYIDYGNFTATDPTGLELGTFSAGEYAMNIGWGRDLDSLFSIGANLKGIYSSFESYSSSGMAVDVAGTYNNEEHRFTVSFIARNIGMQLKTYRPGDRENLPFELQLGLSKRLEHLPLRFNLLLTHLEKWDLTYDDPLSVQTDPLTGKARKKNGLSEFGDKLMRHIVIGAELQPMRFLSLRVGYNYQRRQEMKVESNISTVGFSWGVGLRVSKFSINYARSTQHLAAALNYITISTNLDDLF
jgi:hypothetical protein